MYYLYGEQRYSSFSRSMTVMGEGTVRTVPDTATIQIGVVTEGDELSEVQRRNALIMGEVMDVLADSGIPKENIQTTVYSVQPRYHFVDGQQVFDTYDVTNQVTVTLPTVEGLGDIVDLAVHAGANYISHISFSLGDDSYYYKIALNRAVENAVAKAVSLSDTLNLTLDTTPVKIEEESYNLVRPLRTLAMETMMATPIAPGALEITARVKVRFRY
ncbi:SIMPL domain-containing protein [Bacillus sp. A301a_S52]|nr:SIMPL domain-containing protein [Bacillus sp. A301a_S52]